MTKEEFLTIISDELERAEQRYSEAKKAYGESRSEEALYLLKSVEKEVETLRNLVNLPAYERIRTMSDFELEEYKNEQIEELNPRIQELETRKTELIEKYYTIYNTERKNEIDKIEKEIEELKQQQEQIRAVPVTEVRQQLLGEVKGKYDIARITAWSRADYGVTNRLSATVASDPQKARQLADLGSHYTRLSDIKPMAEVSDAQLLLPELSKYETRENARNAVMMTNDNKDEMLGIVEKYEADLSGKKAFFDHYYTEENLSKLARYGDIFGIPDNVTVDMAFFGQFADKIPTIPSRLNIISTTKEELNKLNKKIIKTKKTKLKIAQLNQTVRYNLYAMSQEIQNWYMTKSQELGLPNPHVIAYETTRQNQNSGETVNYNRTVMDREALEENRQYFSRKEQELAMLKHNMQQASVELKASTESLENAKANVGQQIKDLTGQQDIDLAELHYPADRQRALDAILDAKNYIEQQVVVQEIRQEAQKQSDTREAELREGKSTQTVNSEMERMLNEAEELSKAAEPSYSIAM